MIDSDNNNNNNNNNSDSNKITLDKTKDPSRKQYLLLSNLPFDIMPFEMKIDPHE